MPRLKAKTDINQKEVVKTFRQLGCLVHLTHQAGKGFPDAVVQIGDRQYLVEIKSDAKKTFTPDQVAFQNLGWKVLRVNSCDDVIKLVADIRKTW